MLEQKIEILRRSRRFIVGAIIGIAANLVGCLADENDSIPDSLLEPEVYTPYGIGVVLNEYNPNRDIIDTKYLAATECTGLDPEQQQEFKDNFVINVVTDKYSFINPSTGEIVIGLYHPDSRNVDITEEGIATAHEMVHAVLYQLKPEFKSQECYPEDYEAGTINCGKDNFVGICGNEVDAKIDAEWGAILTPYGLKVKTNGFNPNLEAIDEHYIKTTSCMGFTPEEQNRRKGDIVIEIITDQLYFFVEDQTSTYYYRRSQANSLLVTEDCSSLSEGLVQALNKAESNDRINIFQRENCGKAIDAELKK